MRQLDFTGLAARLLASAESHLAQWLPAGKRRGNEYVCGDLYGSEGDSLSVNINTGKWSDFATGEAGGDLISLYAAIHGMEMGAAYKDLGGESTPAPTPTPTSKPPSRTVITPVPESAPEPNFHHREHGDPSAIYRYQDSDFQLLGYIARYDPPGGKKQIIPWTYSNKGWGAGQWPEPRPLYGLDLISAYPEKPILIVEGEKAADAARQFITSYNVITWPGGSQAFKKADWAPLKAKRILFWPDADEPGHKAAEGIASILALKYKCTEIKIIGTDLMPDGWDAADSNFTTAEFLAWAKPRVTVYQAPTQTPDQPHPPSTDEPNIVFASMPMRTAALFKETRPAGGRILYWRGQFYTWTGHKYETVDDVAIEQQLYYFLSTSFTWKAKDDPTLIPFHP